jgi:hypothetical protein
MIRFFGSSVRAKFYGLILLAVGIGALNFAGENLKTYEHPHKSAVTKPRK